MKVIIIGAGIIGAAMARDLMRRGADVTVIEGGAGATAASFGWINASFHQNAAHFALRAEGIAAWRRADVPLAWSGCLCWEQQGAALEAQRDDLLALGYPVEDVSRTAFARLEPRIAAPDRALRFAQEGMADPVGATRHMLSGVRRIGGVRVRAVTTRAGQVTGIDTDQGQMGADRVIVAAGNGAPDILRSVDVVLPMLARPGVMMRTAPVPPAFSHILVSPDQEMRQDAAGHIWAPTAANHQGDTADTIDTPLDALADTALDRVRAVLPGVDLRWDRVILAHRPVPQDGLPVIGACGPAGLFASVMHSGVTLAAVAAELLGAQVVDRPLTNAQRALVAPYDPARFQG